MLPSISVSSYSSLIFAFFLLVYLTLSVFDDFFGFSEKPRILFMMSIGIRIEKLKPDIKP
jgi:energy-converting hydrogenase Eha subunit B